MQVVHGNKRGQHGNGQGQNGDECGAEMEEEHDADEADDDGFGDEVTLQGVDRLIDKPGAVVAGHDLDTGWQRRCDLLQLCLYAVDYIEGIHSRSA